MTRTLPPLAAKPLVPGRTALIVIDLMPRIVERDLGPYKGVDVVAQASRLVTAVRQTGRPADRQTGRPADRQTGRPAGP